MAETEKLPLRRETFLPQFTIRTIRNLGGKVGVILVHPSSSAFVDILNKEELLLGIFAYEVSGLVGALDYAEPVKPLSELSRLPQNSLVIILTPDNTTKQMALLRELRDEFPLRFLTYGDITKEFDFFNHVFSNLSPFHEPEFVVQCHFGMSRVGCEALYTTVPLKGKHVMELGPMDTAMTGSILCHDPAKITVVECYWENVLKCYAVKKCFHLDNMEIIIDDFHNLTKLTYEPCDVLFAHGVIYHSHEPILLCEQLSEISSNIIVGVLCLTAGRKIEKTRRFLWHDKEWTAEVGADASKSVGGPGSFLYYFTEEDWKGIFQELGFRIVDIALRPGADNERDYLQFAAVK